MKLIVRSAVLRDLVQVAQGMRREDVQEVEANTGEKMTIYTLAGALPGSPGVLETYSATIPGDAEPCLVFGVSRSGEGPASPWMLCTPAVSRAPLATLAMSRRFLKRWLKRYGQMTNVVDLRNGMHIAWLRHLGATFSMYPEWINEVPFVRFWFVPEEEEEEKSCVPQQSSPASA